MALNLREKTEKFTTTLYPSTKNKLHNIAKKYKTSKSRIIEYLVLNNYDELMKDNKKTEKKEV